MTRVSSDINESSMFSFSSFYCQSPDSDLAGKSWRWPALKD
jgi:hypothetical protein